MVAACFCLSPSEDCTLSCVCEFRHVLCPAGSVDVEADLLEVQVSGKSTRSVRRLTSRKGLTHLKSAPAGALQAAAEMAVADHMSGSSSGYLLELADSTSPLSATSPLPSSARSRWNRSQSHLDIPRHGSQAITFDTASVNLDCAASSSSGGQLPMGSSDQQMLPPYMMSPAAAPEVQQAPLGSTSQQAGSSQGPRLSRQLSRKISGNKLILSSADNMEAKTGEIMLPPQATPFAKYQGGFDDLEICFSGKSTRMSRGGVRQSDGHTIAAH